MRARDQLCCFRGDEAGCASSPRGNERFYAAQMYS